MEAFLGMNVFGNAGLEIGVDGDGKVSTSQRRQAREFQIEKKRPVEPDTRIPKRERRRGGQDGGTLSEWRSEDLAGEVRRGLGRRTFGGDVCLSAVSSVFIRQAKKDRAATYPSHATVHHKIGTVNEATLVTC